MHRLDRWIPAPKAVIIAAQEGASVLRDSKRVVVVGGGIAGISAATVLAERGVQVELHEMSDFWGGRAGSWTEQLKDGTSFEMERGFHAFFRQYYNLRRLMARVLSLEEDLLPLNDYPLLGPNGARESFSNLPRRAPLNLITLLQRSDSFAWRDILRLDHKQARQMLMYDRDRTYRDFDEVSAQSYLDSLGFSEPARRMLFDVFAHSFFNPEANFSAAELIMMFHYYFLGNPEGLVFDVLRKPFGTALWNPLIERLRALGSQAFLQSKVTGLQRLERGWVVESSQGESEADAVVLALTPAALKTVWSRVVGAQDAVFEQQIKSLALTRPFAVWRLWTAEQVNPERAPFAGTTGLGLLDNISIYERFENESADWSREHQGSVIELHAYAVPEQLGEEEIKADLLRGLHAVYPECQGMQIVEQRFLLRQDCPSFEPGSDQHRPGVTSPWRSLKLAGDCVRLPWPSALMERAATSGMLAANELLADWGGRTEELWTIPTRGMLAAWPRTVAASKARSSSWASP